METWARGRKGTGVLKLFYGGMVEEKETAEELIRTAQIAP